MTLLELCVRAAAVADGGDSWRAQARATYRAGKVCAFVTEWAQMMRETGIEKPTLSEWADWAHVSRATSFRRQEEFRALFGEWHDDPTPLARYVNEWAAKHGDAHPRAATVPDVLAAA